MNRVIEVIFLNSSHTAIVTFKRPQVSRELIINPNRASLLILPHQEVKVKAGEVYFANVEDF